MTCVDPLVAYELTDVKTPNGKKAIVFGDTPPSGHYKTIFLPCGQCIGCRLERSRQWAVRCVHEASLYGDNNCFLTLTYDDDHVPWSFGGEQTLVKEHFSQFIKRLRARIYPAKVRFFMCGEYGSETFRPHYHAILFGWKPPDLSIFKVNLNGDTLYNSNLVSDCWRYGHVVIGDVTFDSCAYVARYILKKASGELAKLKYSDGLCPEFTNMSRRPGIGKDWFNKYSSDVYPYDEVVIHSRGKTRKLRPPKYYDKLMDNLNSDLMDQIKDERVLRASKKQAELFERGRLKAKERYLENIQKSLKRSLD